MNYLNKTIDYYKNVIISDIDFLRDEWWKICHKINWNAFSRFYENEYHDSLFENVISKRFCAFTCFAKCAICNNVKMKRKSVKLSENEFLCFSNFDVTREKRVMKDFNNFIAKILIVWYKESFFVKEKIVINNSEFRVVC